MECCGDSTMLVGFGSDARCKVASVHGDGPTLRSSARGAEHMSSIAGELVTETLDYDGGRQVTVYVPPNPAKAVVFAADGGWHMSRLREVLEFASSPSTMIVGVHGLPDDQGRLHEYVPRFDAERFAAHEEFFVHDVRRWVESRFGIALPAERTGVWGASLGGEFALAMGLGWGEEFPLMVAWAFGN